MSRTPRWTGSTKQRPGEEKSIPCGTNLPKSKMHRSAVAYVDWYLKQLPAK